MRRFSQSACIRGFCCFAGFSDAGMTTSSTGCGDACPRSRHSLVRPIWHGEASCRSANDQFFSDYSGDLGSVRAGGPEHGDSRTAALCCSYRRCNLVRAVCNPIAGYGEDRAPFWPGDVCLVFRYRADGDHGHCAASIGVRCSQSCLWPVLPVFTWGHQFSDAGRGVSMRNRR
jgi:hypothetical protein